ncbi:MAG: hypothetical protein M3Q89_02690 [Verrucomicrobiota bacterium]|nr:hypothetical protein [Verrucomicrobiota bacterium]
MTPHEGDSRYVKRGAGGRFKESDDVGRSLKQDRTKKAKKKVKSGYGDQGDRKTSTQRGTKRSASKSKSR